MKEIEGGDGSVFDISVGALKVLDDAGDGANDERTYAPGGYDVSETFGNGGAIGSDWTVVFSGDCDAAGRVSLAYGDAKTCTITNKRKPKLTVVKVIEGGNGASFDLKVNGSTVLNDVDGVGGQVTNTHPVDTAYSVTETLGDGSAVDPAVWQTSNSADCEGTLHAGEHKTCTITNKRKPKLTVVKVIEGGNGASFDLKVNGSTVLNDVDGAAARSPTPTRSTPPTASPRRSATATRSTRPSGKPATAATAPGPCMPGTTRPAPSPTSASPSSPSSR